MSSVWASRKAGSYLIRMHENRAMYDWGGWLQWKPVGGKQWYTMHSHAIRPKEQLEMFVNTYLDQMEEYRAVIKITGWWDRELKEMVVEQIVGIEQT